MKGILNRTTGPPPTHPPLSENLVFVVYILWQILNGTGAPLHLLKSLKHISEIKGKWLILYTSSKEKLAYQGYCIMILKYMNELLVITFLSFS
jgi:hypothetical protein